MKRTLRKKASNTSEREVLARNLARYATVAGAVLAMGTPAAEAIPFTSGPQNILLGPGESVPIDLDGDLAFDFSFQVEVHLGNVYNWMAPLTGGLAVAGLNQPVYGSGGTFLTTYAFARRLGTGMMISSALFGTPAGYLMGLDGPVGTLNGGPLGNFAGERGYLGVEFAIGGSTHYGWFDVSAAADLTELTIHGWGYENEADTASHTPVPEPGTLALLAMGAAGLAALRRRRNRSDSI